MHITCLEEVVGDLRGEHVPLPPRQYLGDDGVAHVVGHNVRRAYLELPPQFECVLGGGEDGVDVLRSHGLVREPKPEVVEHQYAKIFFENLVAPGIVVARGGETVHEDDGLGAAVPAAPAPLVKHLVAVGDLDVASAALPITQI